MSAPFLVDPGKSRLRFQPQNPCIVRLQKLPGATVYAEALDSFVSAILNIDNSIL